MKYRPITLKIASYIIIPVFFCICFDLCSLYIAHGMTRYKEEISKKLGSRLIFHFEKMTFGKNDSSDWTLSNVLSTEATHITF